MLDGRGEEYRKERERARAGCSPLPTIAACSASKAAIVNLAVSLAKELGDTGITANAISPGPVLTPGLEKFLRKMGAQRGWPTEPAELERRFVAEFDPNPAGRIGGSRTLLAS
jgi:NAD(P)-dependent dehydrogenase (short-subunit alcohol dehydrogenase family)